MMTFEQLKNITKEHKVPIRINLMNRLNQCETILDFVSVDEEGYRYRIFASYPFGVTGKDPVIAVDFSEGPTLHIGDKIDNKMTIIKFELPYIICKK